MERAGTSVDPEETIRLGLNLPMFLASLVALFFGIFPGILGVWLYAAWRIVVPEYIKVGHAHAAWWSVLILIAGLLLPAAALKPSVKKYVIFTSFVAVPFWMIALAAYYISKAARGVIAPLLPVTPGQEYSMEYLAYGTGIFVIELWLFATLALVFMTAMGVRLPKLSQPAVEPTRFDLWSDVEIPRRVLRIPLISAPLGLLLGWAMTVVFKARGLPIKPAALVQLHSHTFFFVVGFLMTLIAVRAVGASERGFTLAYRLGAVGIPLIILGWILFLAFGLHSLVHLVPSVLYFLLLLVGLAALWGRFGLREIRQLHFGFLRGALIFTWILMIVLASVGPVLSLGWDTNPNITVTYRQPQGTAYPGAYPEKYIGTGPVPRSPRGLENLHLSPGSWTHVGIFWLLTLLLVGGQVEKVLGRPTLIFLAANTIPLAPLFNAIGRIGAWADLPAGIGAMFFAGHPLKFFNVFLLAGIAIVMMHRKSKRMLEAAASYGGPVRS